MDLLDGLVVALLVLAAVGGHRLGFVARSLSWLGLVLGLFVGVRATGLLLSHMNTLSHSLILGIALGVMLLSATVGQMVGLGLSRFLRPALRLPALGPLDRVGGALAGMIGVLLLLWLSLPILTAVPGPVSQLASASWLAQQLDSHLPVPPDSLQALRSAIGFDLAPDVFATLRPTPALGPPPAQSGLSVSVSATTARSVLKIEGDACDRVQDGTGFVLAPDLVVTKALVVAGERSTAVIRDDGRRLPASVIAFDPERDVALLQVASLDRPALPLGPETTRDGSIGGVFGHPGGAPLRIAPYRVTRTIDAVGHDIYGGGRTTRRVLELAAGLRPGDSGSPLVDPGGDVIGLAFAISRDRSDVAYALAPSEFAAIRSDASSAPVATGACLA